MKDAWGPVKFLTTRVEDITSTGATLVWLAPASHSEGEQASF